MSFIYIIYKFYFAWLTLNQVRYRCIFWFCNATCVFFNFFHRKHVYKKRSKRASKKLRRRITELNHLKKICAKAISGYFANYKDDDYVQISHKSKTLEFRIRMFECWVIWILFVRFLLFRKISLVIVSI